MGFENDAATSDGRKWNIVEIQEKCNYESQDSQKQTHFNNLGIYLD